MKFYAKDKKLTKSIKSSGVFTGDRLLQPNKHKRDLALMEWFAIDISSKHMQFLLVQTHQKMHAGIISRFS